MDWMVSNSSTHKNEAVTEGWDVRSLGTTDLDWVLNPNNGNVDRVLPGDNVIVFSHDDHAFTHIGVFTDTPDIYGNTATRLMRLDKPISRSDLEQQPEWRTTEGNPRTPFSKANTFSQPVNITERWGTIWGAMNKTDRSRFRSLWSSDRLDRRDLSDT